MIVRQDLKNITCKDYCKLTNSKYSVLINEKFEKVSVPHYFDEITEPIYIDVPHPEVYIAELENINVIGENSVMFDDNNNAVFDAPFQNSENRWDLRYYSTFYVDPYVTCVAYEETNEIIDEGIMLLGSTYRSFYHFTVELLTKLVVLNELNEYKNMPIIVQEEILNIPNLKEELNLINQDRRKIIYVKAFHKYKVKKLIYISDLTLARPGIWPEVCHQYSDTIMNPEAIKLINKYFTIPSTLSKKVYISRKKSRFSRLENQEAVESIFSGFGYEIVCTEDLTTDEKINLFSQCKFVAGPYGSSLTHMLFANKNATIICIQPKVLGESQYANIATILNQKCYYVDAIPTSEPPYTYHKMQNGNVKVNIEMLVKLLYELHCN